MTNSWLRQLMETVSACWEWHALALRIGFEYREPEDKDDCWEVWVYPPVQEILGGKNDGETAWCGFNFDLDGFLEEIETEAVTVSTRLEQAPPEIVVEGKFRGIELLLHVCLEPPDAVEASEIIDLTDARGASVREKE